MGKLLRVYVILGFLVLQTGCEPVADTEDTGSNTEESSGTPTEPTPEDPSDDVVDSEDPTEDPETPTDPIFKYIKMDWDGKHADAELWSEYTLEAIETYGDALMNVRPSDVVSFCPTYDRLNDMGRQMFWIHLLSVMTRYESYFNPNASYQEAFKDSSGTYVISRGLLQLSKESSLGYGCDISVGADLYDPQANLTCGIRILNRWIERDGVISANVSGSWKGGARYWAVLRTYSTRNPLAEVKARTVQSEVCKIATVDPIYLEL